MRKLNKLAELCYDTAVKRGKINKYTSFRAQLNCISREWRELSEATDGKSEHLNDLFFKHSDEVLRSTRYKADNLPVFSEREEEAADVIIATLTYLNMIACKDIELLIKMKVMYNALRTD